ncbi:hypothetical protein SAMN05216582_1511 [Selenomonas ruminantium]|uniref:Uncharacterized protein n=1 Tax=Selenomonas ruminantium TaxID=971 RepID=A0A1M6Y0Q6_SELRU|nr:hypothetical protein [Selenomonas ruminantium]SHL11831.1 hypothetical protein SAMN05216582_1511 [Selenomonas ruminantium]
MTMQDKKELQCEEMSSVTGGNAVGPVNETGPLNETVPLNYPYELKNGPLMPGPVHETGSLISRR